MKERKMRKQKVRFSRGDKRPAIYKYKLSYEKKLVCLLYTSDAADE